MRRRGVAAAAIPIICAALAVAGCGGGDKSSQIASAIGATTCAQEDYMIVSRLDGSKERIYNCTLHGNTICVVDQGGIDKNVTAEARILFSGDLGGGKPSCIG